MDKQVKILASTAASLFLLLMFAAPSTARREVFGEGDVHLGACDGATAAYVQITPLEDADSLGLGGNDRAASLTNLGTGQSGVSFFPQYDSLTADQKAQVQFSVASIYFKSDANALKNSNINVCFSDGNSKSIPLNSLKRFNEILGWQKVQLGPTSFGISDANARRLDRLSVTLAGEGHLSVGNVESFWEINAPRGGQLFLGWNLYSNLHTDLRNCSILTDCK
ncbi:MAG: hypothetical protein JST44_18075 [Cyanobacteria bacterium SZAS LIN-5]|nr:hypothetical protein [Cyanobacteria bacterium SZAS LIN-5]